MSECVNVSGWGAVSPAGWSSTDLLGAISGESEIPEPEKVQRDGVVSAHSVRRVPKPPRLPFLRDPRLRRTSALGRFIAGASFEALAGRDRDSLGRMAVVFSSVNGCVNYSARFFREVLDDPSLASPILFPETVFNAPSSHLSATFDSSMVNYTIVGDSANFLSGMELGVRWLVDDQCDSALIVAGDEYDFLSSEGFQLLTGDSTFAEGAGALLLQRNAEGPSIELITDPVLYTARMSRREAVSTVRQQLSAPLVDPPSKVLGEGMGAKAAWQCVLAVASLAQGEMASVLAEGETQQAIGATFRW